MQRCQRLPADTALVRTLGSDEAIRSDYREIGKGAGRRGKVVLLD